ncbi:MAG: hypothetical protein HZC28_10145 [Spirochaetes bacterium]|nr:hypothetical protein [Spirochaetota bacterium]
MKVIRVCIILMYAALLSGVPFFSIEHTLIYDTVNADSAAFGGHVAGDNPAAAVMHNPGYLSFLTNEYAELSGRFAMLAPSTTRDLTNQRGDVFGYTVSSFGIGARGGSFLWRTLANGRINAVTEGDRVYSYAYSLNEYSCAYGVKEGALKLRGGLVVRLYSGTLYYNEVLTNGTQISSQFENPIGTSVGYGMVFDQFAPLHLAVFFDNIPLLSYMWFERIPDITMPFSFRLDAGLVAEPFTAFVSWKRHITDTAANRIAGGVSVKLPLRFTLSAGITHSFTDGYDTVSFGLANSIGMHTAAISAEMNLRDLSFMPDKGAVYMLTYRIML